MIKKCLGLFALSALFVGCGDTLAPTQPQNLAPLATPVPTRTPGPNPALAPIVTSAEPTTRYYGRPGWIIRGSHFLLDEKVTLESGRSVIELGLEEVGRPDFIGVLLPPGTAPGMYAPCVETIHGKGCGNFLVTVE